MSKLQLNSSAYPSPNKRIPGAPPSASRPSRSDLFASSRVPPLAATLELPESDTSSSSSSSSDITPSELPKGPPDIVLSPPVPGRVRHISIAPTALPPDHPRRPENIASSRDYGRRSTGFLEPHIMDFAEAPTTQCIFARDSCSPFMTTHPVSMCHDCYNREMKKAKKRGGWIFGRKLCFGTWLAAYTAIIVTIVVLVMFQQRKEALKYQRDQFWKDQQGRDGDYEGMDSGL